MSVIAVIDGFVGTYTINTDVREWIKSLKDNGISDVYIIEIKKL